MSEAPTDVDTSFSLNTVTEPFAPVAELKLKPEVSTTDHIKNSLKHIEESSKASLEDYVEGKLQHDVTMALVEHTRLQILLKWSPEKRDEIMAVMPDTTDWRYYSVEDKAFIERQKTRDQLREYAPYKYGGKKKLDEEAIHFAKIQAEDAINKAKKESEASQDEGSILIISTKPEDILKIIENGKYTPSLDNPELGYNSFWQTKKDEIKAMANGAEYSTIGFGPLERRYTREVLLDLYPQDGDKNNIPHPVYGQMVVDEETVSKHMSGGESYGNVHLQLKTENIKDRTAFYMGDSINNVNNGFQLNWNEAVKARALFDSLEKDPHLDWRRLPPYVEAEIMGGVSTKDIQGCSFVSDETTKELESYFLNDPNQFEVIRFENSVKVKFK